MARRTKSSLPCINSHHESDMLWQLEIIFMNFSQHTAYHTAFDEAGKLRFNFLSEVMTVMTM